MYDSVPHGFRQIPGFPRYAINEHGMVLSICGHGFGAGTNRPWTDAKRLKPVIDRYGYPHVHLRHDGHRWKVSVHRLVLTTFVGSCPDGMECRHLDGNPANNHVSNLAWGTRPENSQDKVLHGTSSQGDKNGRSKLNDSDVLEIRRRAANGESRNAIANAFALDVSNVCLIVLRKTWKHI